MNFLPWKTCWRTIEAKTSGFFYWKNERVNEINLKTFFFTFGLVYSKKRKNNIKRDGLMQQMSRGRDQWQLNAHKTKLSLNTVTKRSNGQESLQSRMRSSTHVNIEIRICSKNQLISCWRNSNDNFWTFCMSKICLPLPQKFKQDKSLFKTDFLEIDLFEDFFGWKNTKNENSKDSWKIEKEFVFFFSKKRWRRKSQGDRSPFFSR